MKVITPQVAPPHACRHGDRGCTCCIARGCVTRARASYLMAHQYLPACLNGRQTRCVFILLFQGVSDHLAKDPGVRGSRHYALRGFDRCD